MPITPAVLVTTSYTESSARGGRSYAQIGFLGAFSSRLADPVLGEPEPQIDLTPAAGTLLAASDVEELACQTVAVDSPFGI